MITTCNSHVAITRIRTFLTCVMAFSDHARTDAESYFGGTSSISQRHEKLTWLVECPTWQSSLGTQVCSTARLFPWLLSGLPHLCIEQTCSRSSYSAWLSPPETEWLPLVCSPVVSVNEEPVIHACNKQTVLLFMPSFVNVRPPRATNTNAAPIAIRIMTTCFVGSNLLIRWLQWLDFWFGGARLSYVIITKNCPSWSRLHLSQWMVPTLVHVVRPICALHTQLDAFSVVQSTSVWWMKNAETLKHLAQWKMLRILLCLWNCPLGAQLAPCVFVSVCKLGFLQMTEVHQIREVNWVSILFRWTDDFWLLFHFLYTQRWKIFNLSHYLSTAPCNWFSFLALGWSCPNFKTCTVWSGCFLEFRKSSIDPFVSFKKSCT